jgi:DNA polymerase III subunit alpha
LKDISKLYGVSFEEANSVTTIMETEAKPELMAEVGNDQKLYELTFDGLKRYSPTFQKFLVKYPKIEEHIVNLYHEVKAIGRHAGGVLVVPDAESCLPVIKIRNVQQSPISEGITVKHLKYFGLVKFDVLGLATLRIIERCIEIILKRRGNKKPTVADIWEFYRQNLHPSVIDEADPMVFKKVYQDGNFPSIFQFAEKAVQKFCKSAMPNSVSDLSAITALFRPGPLSSGAHLKFLGAVDKKNIEAFKKEHPILQEVLGETRGVLLYQEEFMLLSHKLAGFTLEEANRLRKLLVQPETSMAEELKRERIEIGQKFIKGCIDKGLTEDRATILWEKEILPWCSYGFNKSHSVSYAFNSYQCAWLYTYYEAEWIKACLERDPNPQETLGVVRSLGYVVEKPDVNKSDVDEWVVDNDKCCVPSLTSLKGVGSTGAQELVRYRPMGGYKSLQDFFYSGDEWRYSKLNKKCLQALLRMDAFRNIPGAVGKDGIFKNHAHLENALFNEGERPSKAKVGVLVKYKNFDLIKDKKTTFEVLALETDSTDWTSVQKIEHQKEIVGFYDKSLIVGKYLPMFREFEIDAIDEADDEKAKKRVWAIVDEITQKVAKTGQKKPFIVVKASGITEKPYTFRVWNTMASKSLYWVPGNVLVFGLQYSDEWGYAVPANAKIIKVER